MYNWATRASAMQMMQVLGRHFGVFRKVWKHVNP